MSQLQEYRVRATHGRVELREYAPCVLAECVVAGSAEQAGNTAFRPLVGYISGANRTSTRMAMTAPVPQEARGERLAMTAPVLQEPAGEGSWTVSFVLPGARELADYPQPTDPRVTLRALPPELAAALGWSGRWTTGNVQRHTAQLRAQIAAVGWTEVGPPRWARYDPPWRPAFARRNEIIIPVRTDTA